MTHIRIASRASRLALAQSQQIRDQLLALAPTLTVSIVEVTTRGDVDRSDYLHQARSVGMFTSEVQNALLDGRADLAVHSFKDLPTGGPEELITAAVPHRESPADALVSRFDTARSLADLPAGSSVGTSSLRRIAQIRHLRPDLDCRPLRGNVETRLATVDSGQLDSIVLAQAGLNRLGLGDSVTAVLDPEQFVPAPAQGALAIEVRRADQELVDLVGRLDDPVTRAAVSCERRVLALLHGGCSIPLGVYAHRLSDGRLGLRAVLSSLDARQRIEHRTVGSIEQADSLATSMAEHLLAAGAQDLLASIRIDP